MRDRLDPNTRMTTFWVATGSRETNMGSHVHNRTWMSNAGRYSLLRLRRERPGFSVKERVQPYILALGLTAGGFLPLETRCTYRGATSHTVTGRQSERNIGVSLLWGLWRTPPYHFRSGRVLHT